MENLKKMANKTNKQTVLLFDIDNTLINRDFAFSSYIINFIERFPDFFNGTRETLVKKIIEIDNRGLCERSLFIEKMLAMFPKISMTPEELWNDHQHLSDFIKPDKKLQLMLKRLSQKHAMTIVSNGSGITQRRKLKKSGLDQFFKTCFISGEVGYRKPEKEIFQKALFTLGYSPENAVMIGDNPDNDVSGAQKLGIKTIWISEGIKTNKKIGDVEIDQIKHLEEVLPCLI